MHRANGSHTSGTGAVPQMARRSAGNLRLFAVADSTLHAAITPSTYGHACLPPVLPSDLPLEAWHGKARQGHPDELQLQAFDALARRRLPDQAPSDSTRQAGNSRRFSTIFSCSDLLGDIDGNGLSLIGRLAGKTSSVK